MAVSKKPRKKYRPRVQAQDPVNYVLSGFKPLEGDHKTGLKLKNWDAFEKLRLGKGALEDWRIVTGALNLAVVLDELHYQSDYRPSLDEALLAHGRCGARHWKGQNFGYSGLDLQLVRLALEVHDEQLELTTVGELEAAVKEVLARERSPKHRHSAKAIAATLTA